MLATTKDWDGASPRARAVAHWFGLSPADVIAHLRMADAPPLPPDLAPLPGQILLITGASGSGKSTLLRALRQARAERPWVDLARTPLPDRAVVDVMADALGREAPADEDDAKLLAALEALSRVGLGEVWTYLRRPAQLSDGQRWRLRLAVGAARAGRAPRPGAIVAADEFGALLDRVTARVVARALRRLISADAPLAAVVATSHDDLTEALAPDVIARCDFGRVDVQRAPT